MWCTHAAAHALLPLEIRTDSEQSRRTKLVRYGPPSALSINFKSEHVTTIDLECVVVHIIRPMKHLQTLDDYSFKM